MTSQDQTTDPANEGPEGFREAKKHAETERDEARAELQAALAENVAFKVNAAGLNPEQGIGKSIVKDINRGDYEGEITPTALKAYAFEEYNETVEVSDEQPDPVEPEPDNDLAADQAQVDELQTAGSSQVPVVTAPEDTISQLQTEMLRPDATPDEVAAAVGSSITMKVNKLRDDWKKGRIQTTPEP